MKNTRLVPVLEELLRWLLLSDASPETVEHVARLLIQAAIVENYRPAPMSKGRATVILMGAQAPRWDAMVDWEQVYRAIAAP
jgi:hypothetical protein